MNYCYTLTPKRFPAFLDLQNHQFCKANFVAHLLNIQVKIINTEIDTYIQITNIYSIGIHYTFIMYKKSNLIKMFMNKLSLLYSTQKQVVK